MCRELVDGVVLVDNSAISAAIKDVFNETRCILEPAGAVAVAGAKAYLARHNMQAPPLLCSVCVFFSSRFSSAGALLGAQKKMV